MISPALTTSPPKRFTPRYWGFESRPLREELAPFLCAMSGPRLLDARDLEARQVLTVTLALAVADLVLVLQDRDAGSALVTDHLSGDLDLREVLGSRGDLVTVDEKHRRKLHRLASVRLEAVHHDDVANGDLLLTATGLDNRVHHFESLRS